MRRNRICILTLSLCLLLLLMKVGKPIYQFCVGELYTECKSFACEELSCGIGLTDVQKIESQLTEDTESMVSLVMEGVQIPYLEAESCWFLSQNLSNENWDGYVEGTDAINNAKWEIYGDQSDALWTDKSRAIAEGHVFSLWLVQGEKYVRTSVQFTGMPVVEMVTMDEIPPEPITYEEDPDEYIFGSDVEYLGVFRLWESKRQYEIVESVLSYHEKGAAARAYPKKSYSVSLMDRQGKDASVSLLGMRESSSWKLNALYGDPNKIREKTTADLWKQLVEESGHLYERGPQMEYVEVVKDGVYQGLYCLVEPVDGEILSLGQGDYLYKSVDNVVPEDASIQESVDKQWRVQAPIRIRYPKLITDYSAAWKPIREYFNMFYHESDYSYEAGIAMVEPDNLIDMTIFLMVVSGSDNYLRNLYFVADRQGDGSYKIIQIPWDFDLTFGRVPIEGYTGDVNAVYVEKALKVLKHNNPEMHGRIYAAWEQYRQGVYSLDNIVSIMQENMNYIIETGAFNRDSNCWPEAQNSTDLVYLYAFQEERMQWLEKFFDEWTAKR